jgi:hypothetical protein
MLPLSFAFFDWEHEDGALVDDPLALLEALRRYGDRFTIFCQSGQIKLPAKYPPLVTFLEPCIYDVKVPDVDGVFHPKCGRCALKAKFAEELREWIDSRPEPNRRITDCDWRTNNSVAARLTVQL